MLYWNSPYETMPRKELDEFIDRRVTHTVRYAHEFSPFYHELFNRTGIKPSDIKTRDNLKKIPIINSQDILENQPPKTQNFMFWSAPDNQRARILETSGTSAEPKSFLLTHDDYRMLGDEYARAYIAGGISSKDLGLNLCPYGINISGFVATMGIETLGASVIPLGISPNPPRLAVIKRYRPSFISALPSFILRYTKELERSGTDIKSLGIRKIFVGGESLTEEQREYLNENWDAKTFNLYVATETFLGHDCSYFSGLHLSEDYAILDVRDENTMENLEQGKDGNGVLTTLVEPGKYRGMVLINFDTEDIFHVIGSDSCECGRTLTRISSPTRIGELINVGCKIGEPYINSITYRRENLAMGLTGEWEGKYGRDESEQQHVLRLSLETKHEISSQELEKVRQQILSGSYELGETTKAGILRLEVESVPTGSLEIYKKPGKSAGRRFFRAR
jgi:phenylacetate-coenzyme A ligase PaaK-like adenylate-forming protein